MSDKKIETVEEAEKIISDLKDDNKVLAGKLQELQSENVKLTDANEKAIKEVGELASLLAAQEEANKTGSLIVTIGKEKYRLVGKKFIIPGKGEVTASELSKDAKELARMVKIKSGSLIKVK